MNSHAQYGENACRKSLPPCPCHRQFLRPMSPPDTPPPPCVPAQTQTERSCSMRPLRVACNRADDGVTPAPASPEAAVGRRVVAS